MGEKKKKKGLVWVIVAVAVVLIGGTLWMKNRSGSSPTALMSSAIVMQGDLTTTSSFDGNVTASRQQTLLSPVNATVKEIYVSEGDAVRENRRLMRLSDGTVISADLSGQVWELFVQPGDYVTAGSQLANILDPASMAVKIQVDEYDIQSIQPGQVFDVYVSATEETAQAQVTHIGKTAIQTSATTYYEVTLSADLSNRTLPGMQLEATVTKERIENALLLRMEALQYDTAGRVYATRQGTDGKLTSVELTLGSNDGVNVQVLSGLQAGDVVWYTDNQTVVPIVQRLRQ